MHATTAATEADRKAKQDREFQRFVDKAETKMLLTLVPQLEPPELLQTLLRSAFEAGVGAGMGEVLTVMMDSMFKAPKDGGRG